MFDTRFQGARQIGRWAGVVVAKVDDVLKTECVALELSDVNCIGRFFDYA